MTGKLSTFERRIEILFFIISSKKVTLSELSKRYSVHKNTVYNDITFLGRYAPIRAKSGVNGGIFLMEIITTEFSGIYPMMKKECLPKLWKRSKHRKEIL